MPPASTSFFVLTSVLLSIMVTEIVLFACWRRFGDRGAYRWYACLLRVLAYSPCLVAEGQGLLPMPISAAWLRSLSHGPVQINWLYGLPELCVGLLSFFGSYITRMFQLEPK